jgi:hypothetical protein
MHVYPNDHRQVKVAFGSLTVFAVIAVFLILAVVFSPRACS